MKRIFSHVQLSRRGCQPKPTKTAARSLKSSERLPLLHCLKSNDPRAAVNIAAIDPFETTIVPITYEMGVLFTCCKSSQCFRQGQIVTHLSIWRLLMTSANHIFKAVDHAPDLKCIIPRLTRQGSPWRSELERCTRYVALEDPALMFAMLSTVSASIRAWLEGTQEENFALVAGAINGLEAGSTLSTTYYKTQAIRYLRLRLIKFKQGALTVGGVYAMQFLLWTEVSGRNMAQASIM